MYLWFLALLLIVVPLVWAAPLDGTADSCEQLLQSVLAPIGIAAASIAGVWAYASPAAVFKAQQSGGAEWHACVAELTTLVARELKTVDDDEIDSIRATLEAQLAECLATFSDSRKRAADHEAQDEGTKRQAAGSSSVQDATSVLMDGAKAAAKQAQIEASDELLVDPWYRDQAASVCEFVAAIDRTAQLMPGQHHAMVRCRRCGKAKRTNEFIGHVATTHADEFADNSSKSERYWMEVARSCQSALATTHSEMNRLRDALSNTTPAAADASLRADNEQLRAEKQQLCARVDGLLSSLEEQQVASAKFEVHAYRNYRLLQQAAPRRVLCAVAEKHQALHERGVFRDPQNATVEELHLQTLNRMDPDVDASKGGTPTHLSASANALWYFLWNTAPSAAYRMLRKVHRAAPNVRDLRRKHSNRFVGVGTSRQYTDDAASFYKSIGVDIEKTVWQVCWDPVKLMAEAKWDPRTNQLIGHVNIDQKLHFTSKAEMEKFLDENTLAGYVMPFVLCPLDCAIPSTVSVVGLIPTDLTYTQRDLHRYLSEIRRNLHASGFRRFLMRAADNAPQHGKEMILSMSPGAFADERSNLPAIGDDAELEEILSLRSFTLEGEAWPTISTNDISHWIKTWTLQVDSLASCLTAKPLSDIVCLCSLAALLDGPHPQPGLRAPARDASHRMPASPAGFWIAGCARQCGRSYGRGSGSQARKLCCATGAARDARHFWHCGVPVLWSVYNDCLPGSFARFAAT